MAYGSLTRRVFRTICGGGAERLEGLGFDEAAPLCKFIVLLLDCCKGGLLWDFRRLLLEVSVGARELEAIELRAESLSVNSPKLPRPDRSSESIVERNGATVLGMRCWPLS
jgi:hypothetical protein